MGTRLTESQCRPGSDTKPSQDRKTCDGEIGRMNAAIAAPNRKRATPTVGVVFTTYNRPLDLERVLAGYARQTYGRFEIVIADDGSGEETRALHRARARRTGASTSATCGRKTSAFANAGSSIAPSSETEAEYLIFTDGDCIPHPEFVAGHLSLARPGYFVSGGCVRLGDAASRAIAPTTCSTARCSTRAG